MAEIWKLSGSVSAAAELAIDNGVFVQQLDYAKLRRKLLKNDQVLDYQ